MKKILSFLLSATLCLSAVSSVFVQAAEQNVKTKVDYSIVANGERVALSYGDSINVDGTIMLTEAALTAMLSESSFGGITAFDFNGQKYYSLREAANANSLTVFWDSASRTVIVVKPETLDKINALMNASTEMSKDLKKAEVAVVGDISASFEADGEAPIAFDLSLSGEMKFDIDAPFMEMNFTVGMLGQNQTVHAYDDGQHVYTNSGTGWVLSDSAFVESLQMIEQLNSMSAISSPAFVTSDDLTYAGLKLTTKGDAYVLEGEIFTSAIMGDGLQEVLDTMYETLGMDMSLEIPPTMYVKYEMLEDGTIISMSMNYVMTAVMNVEDTSAKISMDADLSLPKYAINGEFEAVVPQEVKDAAAIYMQELDILLGENPMNLETTTEAVEVLVEQ